MKGNVVLFLAVFIFSSCGPTIQVFSDHDTAIKTDDYKTYDWLDIKAIESKNNDPRYYNELTDKRIKNAVNKEMETKGFALAPVKGQLELHYHIIVEDKTSVSTEPVGFIYSPYFERKRTNLYQYREGTLIIDIMDVKTNQLVWRGWGTDVISAKTLKKPEEAINEAVNAIFKKFP